MRGRFSVPVPVLGCLSAAMHVLVVAAIAVAAPATPAATATPAASAASAAPAAPAAPTVPAESARPAVPADLLQGDRIGTPWRVITWPQQKFPATRYTVEPVNDKSPHRLAVRIEAQGSYGNLVHALPGVLAPQRLAWSWRVSQGNPAVVLNLKTGDDAPVKVCLGFDMPLAQVPFVERQLLRFARSRSADPLPAATLCWVWGGAEATGTLQDNPYSRRVRSIVLRRHAQADGTWFDEDRDVAADFRRAFGDESTVVPPVIALIVAGDADNTGGHSIAHLAGLRWWP